MDDREQSMSQSFSIPLGTWLQTQVRVSWFFPLILLVFCPNLGVVLGVTCVLLLFLSVVVHEFFHVFGARLTGGDAREILIWPAGGLAYCQPGPSFRSEFLTTAAGPVANVLIALTMLPVALSSGQLRECWHPVMLPHVDLEGDLLRDWGLLLFALNVKLVYLNLLPVLPMDGGRMLQTVLSRSYPPRTVNKVGLWTGLGVAVVLFLIGNASELIDPENGIAVVSLAAFIFCMNYVMLVQQRIQDQLGGSEFGYDFSEGYSSFGSDEEEQPRPGMIEQWKANREAKRRDREAAERAEEESRLDALLDKVHHHGMDSLTPSEQQFLKQASERRSGRK
jgi:Zn-dependent protease